jgi:hypothetical protein
MRDKVRGHGSREHPVIPTAAAGMSHSASYMLAARSPMTSPNADPSLTAKRFVTFSTSDPEPDRHPTTTALALGGTYAIHRLRGTSEGTAQINQNGKDARQVDERHDRRRCRGRLDRRIDFNGRRADLRRDRNQGRQTNCDVRLKG